MSDYYLRKQLEYSKEPSIRNFGVTHRSDVNLIKDLMRRLELTIEDLK